MGSKLTLEEKKEIRELWLRYRNFERVARELPWNVKTVRKYAMFPEGSDNNIDQKSVSEPRGPNSNIPIPADGGSISHNKNVLFADFVNLRKRGKSIVDCVITLKLTYVIAQAWEKEYLELSHMRGTSDLADRLIREKVNIASLVKVAAEHGSFASYLSKVAELERRATLAKNLRIESERTIADLHNVKDKLEIELDNLDESILSWNYTLRGKEAEFAQLERSISALADCQEKAVASHNMDLAMLKERARESIDELTANLTGTMEELAEYMVSWLVGEMRRNSEVSLAIMFTSRPLLLGELFPYFRDYVRGIVLRGPSYTDNARKAPSGPETGDNPTLRNTDANRIIVHENVPAALGPAQMNVSESIFSDLPRFTPCYIPSAIETYAKEELSLRRQATDDFKATTGSGRIWNVSNPRTPSNSGNCEEGACKIQRDTKTQI